jgi:hypothetical protein
MSQTDTSTTTQQDKTPSYRTIYMVFDSDLSGSRPYTSERKARKHASDMDNAVIVKRSQKSPVSGNCWEDQSHEFIRKDFDSAFFEQNFGGIRE